MDLTGLKDKFLGVFRKMKGDGTKRPDGGVGYYRPFIKKQAEPQPAAEPMAANGPQSSMQGNISQMPLQGEAPVQIHSGFTGMNPPPPVGDASYYPAQDAAQGAVWGYNHGAAVPGNMGFDQGNAAAPGAYAPAFGTEQPAANGAFQQTPVNGNFQQAPANGAFQQSAAPQRAERPNRRFRDNIVQMPGIDQAMPPMNPSSGHVEHILTLTGLRGCYEAIEAMKNGETLIVTMDTIASEGESTRCMDMLSGAAFTLGCNVRMIQGAKVVLIAPPDVQILPEQPRRERNSFFTQAPQVQASYAAPAASPRRERRVSQNTMGWHPDNQAAFNPYTGTQPAPASAFTNFGGY